MAAQYNNNGANPRYACSSMAYRYAEPVCQTLKAAPLDALVERLMREALEPAALEASLLAATDLERERDVIERQWQQRVERSRYEAERTYRQFNAVEPENRLVARTLERQWEQALTEQTRLEAAHERVRRDQPSPLSLAEAAAIRELARDLPGIRTAATQEERQTLVRLLLERILVEVVDGSEQVRIVCHWHGGDQTAHQLIRPVARLTQLSNYNALVAHAAELHRAGRSYAVIAETLNREGWRPAKRRDTFNGSMVHHLLSKTGIVTPKYRRRCPSLDRDPGEWTIAELAGHIPMPEPTLYTWVQQGRLRSRTIAVSGRKFTLIYADDAAIEAIRTVRATPVPWRRRPLPIAAPSDDMKSPVPRES
jgi:hypothetical protein